MAYISYVSSGPIRSTQSFFLRFFPKSPLILYVLVHRPVCFIEFFIGRRHIYSLWNMPGFYNYWWCITSFESSTGKKETHIFFVTSVITFSAFLQLLWNYTLFVCYELNRFRSPRVNQFDISALLFGSYASFIPLDKIILYG